MSETAGAEEILSLASGAGFSSCRVISLESLIKRLDGISWLPGPRQGERVLLPALGRVFSGTEFLTGSFLSCALSFSAGEPEALDTGNEPRGLVAAFARRNNYRDAVRRLQGVVKTLGGRLGLPRARFRIFVNSRIPEKLIAYGTGTGVFGRNGLLFAPECGSRFVIGLLFLPFPVDGQTDDFRALSPEEFCGACDACREACPTAALVDGEMAGLPRCLKTLSDGLAVWDEQTKTLWGNRFYGCDTCQDVCPKNEIAAKTAFPAAGAAEPGAFVGLARIFALGEEGIRAYFKKTALGMSWISPRALLRNALVAAGNCGGRKLIGLVDAYRNHPEPAVADAARWALEKLNVEGTAF